MRFGMILLVLVMILWIIVIVNKHRKQLNNKVKVVDKAVNNSLILTILKDGTRQ